MIDWWPIYKEIKLKKEEEEEEEEEEELKALK
jgi:hypothetical protein